MAEFRIEVKRGRWRATMCERCKTRYAIREMYRVTVDNDVTVTIPLCAKCIATMQRTSPTAIATFVRNAAQEKARKMKVYE
jgi:PHP family Zn ribbon phosphoesterase